MSERLDQAAESRLRCINRNTAHHWIIDPPNGPVSLGRCVNCNQQKKFSNTVEGSHLSALGEGLASGSLEGISVGNVKAQDLPRLLEN